MPVPASARDRATIRAIGMGPGNRQVLEDLSNRPAVKLAKD